MTGRVPEQRANREAVLRGRVEKATVLYHGCVAWGISADFAGRLDEDGRIALARLCSVHPASEATWAAVVTALSVAPVVADSKPVRRCRFARARLDAREWIGALWGSTWRPNRRGHRRPR